MANVMASMREMAAGVAAQQRATIERIDELERQQRPPAAAPDPAAQVALRNAELKRLANEQYV